MIVVTGATGALNGATVDHLLDRLPPSDLVVVARDPARAERFAARGVEVRKGSYEEPDELESAFRGADQVLLVSSNDPGADAVSLHRAAIESAVAAGAARILYTSHQGAAPDSPFAPAKVHAATEDLLAASGVPWTSLRNGFYLHSLDWLTGPWRETGVVSVPADGPVSWTSRDDAAEAAALILTAETPYEGPVTLTAPEAPTFAEVAEIAGEVVGRPVRCEVVGAEPWLAEQDAAGNGRARLLLGMYEAAAAGLFAGTDPLLGELLGRAPRSVRDHLAG
ncbi:SDR family oxidoreductase [Jatrophihabitans sp. YIM 134969]